MNEFGPLALTLLVIPGIALRLAVIALYGRHRLASADPMQTLLSLSSTILLVLAGLGLIVGLVGLWPLMIPGAIVLVILLLMTIDRQRRSEHRALVWALSAAAQKGLPLSEAARAYADETLGDTGTRALVLAEAIERGEPLSAGVQSARLRMGTAMKLAVRLGERLGLLGPAMQQQLDASNQIDAALGNALGRLLYLVNVVLVLTVVSTFVLLRIVPVYERMFEEFGIKLPAITNLVIDLANQSRLWTTVVSAITLPIVAALFLLSPMFGLHYLGWFPRDLPGLWRLFRRFDGALVMRGLALAVRRGMPLPQALALLEETYPLKQVSYQLRGAIARVEHGQDWRESLRQAGLIGQADFAVLAAAERVGNLEWALEEMADSALRRQTYWLQALTNILFPLVLLALAAMVFVFVAGMFMPIISLIQGLA